MANDMEDARAFSTFRVLNSDAPVTEQPRTNNVRSFADSYSKKPASFELATRNGVEHRE